MVDLEFQDAVRWSEYGMACFISATISVAFVQGIDGTFYFWDIVIRTLSGVVPLILTILTYEKLVKPLKKGEIPRNIRKWSMFLTPMGIFGLGIGVYVFAHADEKIKNLPYSVNR